MCAEAVWWRCHRSIVADVLKLRGIEVIHIIDATHSTAHPYTSPARIVDGKLSYAPAQVRLLRLNQRDRSRHAWQEVPQM
jgi:Uncharacterized conserved protein